MTEEQIGRLWASMAAAENHKRGFPNSGDKGLANEARMERVAIRRRKVAEMAAKGADTSAIALRLRMSRSTIKDDLVKIRQQEVGA